MLLRSDLVRASTDAAVHRPWKAGALLGDPPVGRAGSAVASSPRAALGLAPRTPEPSLQSHSFSRSCGTILPTPFIYIVLSTRGYSPWRPDAVMSTAGRDDNPVHPIFKDHRERTGHLKT